MSSFKEIVTKAVVGKAKKSSSNDFTLEPEEKANTILGCWVINHNFVGTKNNNGGVNINGSFDVNVWYSFDNDSKTAVITKRFDYTESLKVPLKDATEISDATEIIVRCLKQPTVSNVNIDGNEVKLSIEKELGVEIVGDTKVKISVEDDEDEYDEVYDEENSTEIDKVDEDYIK